MITISGGVTTNIMCGLLLLLRRYFPAIIPKLSDDNLGIAGDGFNAWCVAPVNSDLGIKRSHVKETTVDTVNDILEAFIGLSVEERKRLVSKMQAVSLLELGKDAKQNLLQGNVQRGFAADLIGAIV